VKQFAARNEMNNIFFLPYQPLDSLSASLSAADLHIVVMGNEFVGIVHPCKIYNILAVGGRFLYIGPDEGHIPDMLENGNALDGLCAAHDDVEKLAKHILDSARRGNAVPGSNTKAANPYSNETLLSQMVSLIEQVN
jgi:hypothetical protein